MRIRSLTTVALLASFTVAMSMHAAFGQQKEDHPLISAEDFLAKLNKGEKIVVLDLRNPGAYVSTSKKIVGAVRVEGEEDLYSKVKDVPLDAAIVTYCTWPDEASSARAAHLLMEKGYKNVRALKGGYYAWLRVDGPLEEK